MFADPGSFPTRRLALLQAAPPLPRGGHPMAPAHAQVGPVLPRCADLGTVGGIPFTVIHRVEPPAGTSPWQVFSASLDRPAPTETIVFCPGAARTPPVTAGDSLRRCPRVTQSLRRCPRVTQTHTKAACTTPVCIYALFFLRATWAFFSSSCWDTIIIFSSKQYKK